MNREASWAQFVTTRAVVLCVNAVNVESDGAPAKLEWSVLRKDLI